MIDDMDYNLGDIVINECASERNPNRKGFILTMNCSFIQVITMDLKCIAKYDRREIKNFIKVVGNIKIVENYNEKEHK